MDVRYKLSRKFGSLLQSDVGEPIPILQDPSYVVSAYLDYAGVRISSGSDFDSKALRAYEEEVGSAFGGYRKQDSRSFD